jgi:hypothetical protein
MVHGGKKMKEKIKDGRDREEQTCLSLFKHGSTKKLIKLFSFVY